MVRYILVGGGAVFIDFIIYILLIHFNSIEPSWAKRISFIAGAFWSFIANKFYTFKKKKLKLNEPILFTIVYLTGFLLNTFSHDIFLKLYNVKILAFIVATLLTVIWNYVGQKWIVFRKNANEKLA